MSEMNCKQYRAGLEETDIAAGETRARFASHAADCAQCRGLGDELAALRGLVAGLARVDAPPDFEFRLRARIRAAESAPARSWSQALRPRAAWLAAAGCVALAAALALQTRNSLTPNAPATAQPPAAARSGANPAAPEAVNLATRDSSGTTATRDSSGEKADEIAGAQSSASRGGSNEAVVTRRGTRAAVAANVARTPHGRAETAAQPGREGVAPGNDLSTPTETNTLSMTGSPVIVSSAIPLPVSADERPLQVLFKDTQGAARVVNVNPITFGSNDPAARPANVTFTKAAKKQGVW